MTRLEERIDDENGVGKLLQGIDRFLICNYPWV